ncbi:hypothetical protein [Hymenobacter jeollabukensis]|uniref:DUF1735 domain-containing protein n=1 Tax=Hymenobacter jeollabukensis TaxID=2025313 RepID=A0A5R8WQ36_9BACT|nr:hypothetical protein [Hymenobacter jeollabukensis]TLM92426.1 hypothetical protein FDY95_13435 [Hymenobacter jeollabukensis]
MKNQLIKLCGLLLIATTAFSCKKEYDNNNLDPLAPSFAEIPVTVTNPDFFERFPVIVVQGNSAPATPPATGTVPANPTTAAPGRFSITFSIPADKGTIKEITRVATGTNGLTELQGTPARQLNYNGNATAPAAVAIPGNGTNTITFTSTLLDYNNYRTRVGAGAGAAPLYSTVSPQSPTQLLYYFVLTLSTPNGDVQVIPMPVRVRIVS